MYWFQILAAYQAKAHRRRVCVCALLLARGQQDGLLAAVARLRYLFPQKQITEERKCIIETMEKGKATSSRMDLPPICSRRLRTGRQTIFTPNSADRREVLTDPDDLSTEESPGISDPTDLLCCIENAALDEALNRISERDRYIFFSRVLHGRSFHELALELDLGYQGVAAAYHRVCKKVKEATGRDVK